MRPFAAAAKQDHHQRILSSVVDSIAGTEIDPKLLNAGADRLAVAEVAESDSIQTSSHEPTARASFNETSQSENGVERPLA